MATGTRSPDPFFRLMDAAARPIDGGFLSSLTAGTTTASPTYSDQACTIANGNPITLSHGHAPTFTPVRLVAGQSYTLVLRDPLNALLATHDNVQGVVTNNVNGSALAMPHAADFTTTSTTYVDFDAMTATITTRGGALLARASFPGTVTTGAQAVVQFVIDGNAQGPGAVVYNTDLQTIPMLWIFNNPAPAAGSHTVKLQVSMGLAGTFTSALQTQAAGTLELLEVNI